MLRTPARLAAPLFGAALLATLASAAGCRDQGGTFVGPPDTGTSVTSCTTNTDCAGRGICMSGICEAVTSCMTDDQCADQNKVCHARRFYCVQCDGTHANECPQGQTCQFDFTCVSIGNGADGGTGDGATSACTTTACNDRTMCNNDQVCSHNVCCPPPSRCISVADCPAAHPECNGATGQCFGGDTCVTDTDCNAHTGCSGGACTCDHGTCAPRADECQADTDCAMDQFCTVHSPPKRCLPAAACSSDAECTASGLVCDLARHHCGNGTPCPMGNECNPTTQKCVAGNCVPKNCLNSPELCTATETCDPQTGMCVANMGGPCTVDTDCPTDRWCNTAMTPSACELGCRDNSSCVAPQICDATHQCAGGMGMVCGDCVTDMDCPAGTQCETMFTNKCYEHCSNAAMQPCVLRPGATCNAFGFCSCLH